MGRLAERLGQVVREVDLHRFRALGVAMREHPEHARQRGGEVDGLRGRLEVPGLELGDDELTLDQAQQAVR